MNWFEPLPPRPETAPAPIEWNDMASAPKDGTWILLDIDDGSKDCADYIYSNIFTGRWNPKNFPELGTHFYEWEVIARSPDQIHEDGEITTHYSEGRVCGWLPLPPVA